jgi:HD-GYP domain-containing protein (c-di-GMP phosphodiesterase class II)
MTLSRATLAGASATAAAAAAILIRREQTRRATERFAAAALETLLKAIDANDADTGAHVRRVATYALILADAADLSEHDCKSIERVALFHDIGKIHEALFDIVREEDSLNPAERRAIATHPAVGASVLEPLRVFYPDLPDGVLAHHERWDGKGYPRGLKGRRIPLSARVVSIVDTFDAITHRRPYHSGHPADVARQAIIDGRGTQFDPDLVDLFLFPPVYARIAKAERVVEDWKRAIENGKPPVQKRRPNGEDTNVPDITFRWRPGRSGSTERPVSDPALQTTR